MPSGAMASVAYGLEETAFQTASAAINKTFGRGSKITGLERNNNLTLIYGLGDREAAVNQELTFQGSFSVETVMSDPWAFQSFLGDYFAAADSSTGKQSTTLNGAHALGATTLTVVSSTGFTVGEVIRIVGNTANTYEIRKVVSAPLGTSIVIDKPLYFAHGTGLAVDELAGTPVTYYYHVFRNPNAIKLNTLTIQNTINITADMQTNLLGCIPTSMSISASVGSLVPITYDFMFGKEDPIDAPAFVAQVASTYNAYSFAYGNLYLPGSAAAPLAAVQSCDITITPNLELIYGLGSRNASTYSEQAYDYSINASMFFQDKNNFQALFMNGTTTYPITGPGSTVAENGLVLHFNDGTNSIVFSFGGVKVDTSSMPQDPTMPIMETVSMKARTLTIYARNAATTSP
jgi:hypothetical protein